MISISKPTISHSTLSVNDNVALVTDLSSVYVDVMVISVYTANLHRLWPFERQEALLRAGLSGYPESATCYRDELSADARRAHMPAALRQRALCFRATANTRRDEQIILPTLAILAWTADDLIVTLAQAAERNALVRVLDSGLSIAPHEFAAKAALIGEQFMASRRREKEVHRGLAGGRASALARATHAQESAERVRPLWILPSALHSMKQIEDLSGLSRNTLKKYLRTREEARAEALLDGVKKRKAQKEAENG